MTPWSQIGTPQQEDEILARRVDADSPHDFRWFRDRAGLEGLLLVVPEHVQILERLPVFRDMRVERISIATGIQLRWTLLDRENEGVFLTFCHSLLEKCGHVDRIEAPSIAIGHTQSWQRLLSAARSPLLTEREQLGLLGEIAVLMRLLDWGLSDDLCIDSWKGPEGASQDIRTPRVSVEAKCVSIDAPDRVRISSEFQLERDAEGQLFLSVAEAEKTDGGTGENIIEWATRLRRRLESENAVSEYARKLELAGLFDDHDYTGQFWELSGLRFFDVGADFPSLTPSSLPAGVVSVRYEMNLTEISDHIVSENEVRSAFGLVRNNAS